MEYAIIAKYILSFHDNSPMVIENGTVLIDGTDIVGVGKDLNIDDAEVINFGNHILMPGLINTHTHAAMTLFRGYADDIPLDSWLNDHIWPMESKLSSEDVMNGAKVAAIEALLSGTTTINSMYWHPDAEARAFSEIGIRGMIGAPIISGINTVKTFEHIFSDWHGKNDDMTRVSINPHAPYTVTGDEYLQIHEYKNNFNQSSDIPINMHTHLAETKFEMEMIRKYNLENGSAISDDIKTSTEYLDSLDILDDKIIVAHAVECTDKDIKILAENKVGVSLNPISNLKLGNNISKVDQMYRAGVKLSLGTDGPASNNSMDMFETMKINSLLQKSVNNDPSRGKAFETLKMATYGASKVIGWNTGAIEVGKKADIILIDLNKPHLQPIFSHNSLISNLVYATKATDVSDVMVNGKWRVRNREIPEINLKNVYENLNKSVYRLIE